MKALIVCQSVSHRSTQKIAQAMAGVWVAEVVSPRQGNPAIMGEFDPIAFGSGLQDSSSG